MAPPSPRPTFSGPETPTPTSLSERGDYPPQVPAPRPSVRMELSSEERGPPTAPQERWGPGDHELGGGTPGSSGSAGAPSPPAGFFMPGAPLSLSWRGPHPPFAKWWGEGGARDPVPNRICRWISSPGRITRIKKSFINVT